MNAGSGRPGILLGTRHCGPVDPQSAVEPLKQFYRWYLLPQWCNGYAKSPAQQFNEEYVSGCSLGDKAP